MTDAAVVGASTAPSSPGRGRCLAAHGALLLATVTFSAWNVLAENFNASTSNLIILCAVRDITSFALLFGAGYVQYRKLSWCLGSNSLAWSDWALLATIGLSGPFLAPLATVLCIAWSSSDTAGILNALAPMFASVLSILCGLENISRLLVLAVLFGSAGGLVALHGVSTSSHSAVRPTGDPVRHIAGVLAGIVMAVMQGVFLCAMKPLMSEHGERRALRPGPIITLAYLFAAWASFSVCLVVAGACGGFSNFLSEWGMRETWLALYAGIVCGAFNFSLITWANETLPVTICALYGAGQPPCTAVIAFLVHGEGLTMMGFVSGALVLASLLIMTYDQSLGAGTGVAVRLLEADDLGGCSSHGTTA
eukprot:gnl/TRDRNA2_/TRDRNA2_101916_c1_seq5.p1 gnl/TRDRNA2_/TRDRNA2_101916_c1~~gnl/TRDRNA2_/TRDRNA2_101916_c1_seq5.p1  ORF type:complete len:378 (-),score=34.72 gnl/TRDRNA2_/TRDRNA2_101916_c1_seq5:98-1192(-)